MQSENPWKDATKRDELLVAKTAMQSPQSATTPRILTSPPPSLVVHGGEGGLSSRQQNA